MFYQNSSNSTKSYKHINSLAALAGEILRSHCALLQSCAHKNELYAGC
jgi:hypothetical protein